MDRSKRQRLNGFHTCSGCGLWFKPDNEMECLLCATSRAINMIRQIMRLEDKLSAFRGSISNTTYTTGKICWKITNFHELSAESNISLVNSVRSHAFFTSQYGYKLSVQLVFHKILNNRKDIFLRPVILKGPNDDFNPWPFRERVTFKIINQTDHQNGKVLTYIPDPETDIFEKPTSEMTVASAGIPFPNVEELLHQGFVKDDTLIIECECKTSDLPMQIQETLTLSCEASE